MPEDNTYSRRRLAYVVETVTIRLPSTEVHGLRPEHIPLLEVGGAFVRGCLEAARGVLTLARHDEFGGIAAAERTAWEMWHELDYLLRSVDAGRNAVKVQVNALIDVIALLENEDAPAGMLARNQDGLAAFATAHPEVVAEVRKQRKTQKHWSGVSRSSITGSTPAARAVYKMLSWETHPDIVAIRDISAVIRNGVGYLELSDQAALIDSIVERSASSTSECLLRAWNAFACYFGQDEIDDAPKRKSG